MRGGEREGRKIRDKHFAPSSSFSISVDIADHRVATFPVIKLSEHKLHCSAQKGFEKLDFFLHIFDYNVATLVESGTAKDSCLFVHRQTRIVNCLSSVLPDEFHVTK